MLLTKKINFGRYSLIFTKPLIMGIINVTPDSFSDRNYSLKYNVILHRAKKMIADGADLIDVGGESTRPYAKLVSLEEELHRVVSVVELLANNLNVPISVDTYKPQVMFEVLKVGASMINDIYALRKTGAIQAVVNSNCAICIMHMQGTPQNMQNWPNYKNVVFEVRNFLSNRVKILETFGIKLQRIILDPGFGFGKTIEHNFQLLNKLHLICKGKLPVLIGLSRKSMFTTIVANNKSIKSRVAASIAGAILAATRGASIIRTHDVKFTADALKIWQKINNT